MKISASNNANPLIENLQKTDIGKRAQELGIEELVRNIVHQGSDSKTHAEARWEGCRLIFAARSSTGGGTFSAHRAAIMSLRGETTEPDHEVGTSIIMPDGTFLYNAALDGVHVKALREGPWVERLTAYSKQLTEQRLQREREDEQKRLEEQRKPFQNIDF